MKNYIVISDCDGVLTDGTYHYSRDGKVAKVYGPHDNDGVKLLKKNNIDVLFISADKRGFYITKKRIDDMKCDLINVSESDRMDFIEDYIDKYDTVFFVGDGIHDAEVKEKFKGRIMFIAPNNARREAKLIADFITESDGGHGAFLDAALFVLECYKKYNK